MSIRRLAVTFTAAVALACSSIGWSIGWAMAANADVPPAGPATVAAALGANQIPAAIVVLVDISDSMSASEHGLYPEVQTQLPQFLAALAQQDPQDRVSVIVFGSRNDTRTIYPMGPPTPNIPLPGDASSLGTDIGYAFQLAMQQLSVAPKNAQLGDVLLLSDGGMWAPDDLTYDGGRGYRAPGWATLRSNVQGLGIPVTGYGLPLTRNAADIDAFHQALTACFGANQQMLSANFGDLTAQLDGTQDRIQGARIVVAAAPDSGHGIQATWNGPASSNGARRLNLPSGQADLSIRLTATTRRIPLRVRALSIQVKGLPAAYVTARISAADIALAPGRSVTLPVHLSWPHVTADSAAAASGRRSWPVTLTLSGHVYSPFTNAIRKFYLDKSFTIGKLTGNTSPGFVAVIPASIGFFDWLLILFLAALAIIAGGVLAGRRARLRGVLIVSTVGHKSYPFTLPARPWFSSRIDNALGIPGLIHVSGNPINHRMRVKLRDSKLPDGQNTLEPGGRTMISGLMITHEGEIPDEASNGPRPSSARSEPELW